MNIEKYRSIVSVEGQEHMAYGQKKAVVSVVAAAVDGFTWRLDETGFYVRIDVKIFSRLAPAAIHGWYSRVPPAEIAIAMEAAYGEIHGRMLAATDEQRLSLSF